MWNVTKRAVGVEVNKQVHMQALGGPCCRLTAAEQALDSTDRYELSTSKAASCMPCS